MQNIFLLTGSNLGDRKEFLDFAIREMKQELIIRSLSSIYASDPWGYESDKPFLNQCIKIEAQLEPYDLLYFLKEIESRAGRVKRSEKYEDRPLDIDILYYGKLIIKDDELSIPHPRLHLRAFTLVPLKEIAPGFRHPLFMKTPGELLSDCPDKNIPIKLDQ